MKVENIELKYNGNTYRGKTVITDAGILHLIASHDLQIDLMNGIDAVDSDARVLYDSISHFVEPTTISLSQDNFLSQIKVELKEHLDVI